MSDMSELPDLSGPNAYDTAEVRRVRQKGRRVKLDSFTFPDSKITVNYRRIGPFSIDDIRAQMMKDNPRPKPPVLRVEDGEDAAGEPLYRFEANPSDPHYQQSLVDHAMWFRAEAARRISNLVLSYGIVIPEDDREMAHEMASEWREVLKATGTDELSMSDDFIYVRYACISSGNDLQYAQAVVLGQSVPTEEAIQRHADSFRGDVSGQTDLRVQDAEVGSPD